MMRQPQPFGNRRNLFLTLSNASATIKETLEQNEQKRKTIGHAMLSLILP